MVIIKADQLEVQNIHFGKLEDNALVKSQKLAFISYKEQKERLMVRTPEFITETYGIPREGPFYTTAKSRAFYKIPFCHERHMYDGEMDYQHMEVFYNKLREIDKHCDTNEFRMQMFGEKFASKYEYQPLVRHPEEDDTFQQTGEEISKYYRPPYTKVKLDLSYGTEKPTFKLYDLSSGEGRKEIELKSFEDILQHMRFLTKHRMVVHFSKLYAMKTASGAEKRKYGIILKACGVECTNKAQRKMKDDTDPFSD
jgi:hypothetical protein